MVNLLDVAPGGVQNAAPLGVSHRTERGNLHLDTMADEQPATNGVRTVSMPPQRPPQMRGGLAQRPMTSRIPPSLQAKMAADRPSLHLLFRGLLISRIYRTHLPRRE
ncbi:hypothetical protein AG1IA_03318 [Rhizoctonia solani AG-1 IA]|uniref:Uncharacterized protein n=1 Tax=Thanatephorus cucumeris (strain AG1-IA) TaxID=983506 RepID=L8WXD3_THACA|nr:hypothetical protein AG1IA_03318 [Rhizoctonia solani AG-1 IA]